MTFDTTHRSSEQKRLWRNGLIVIFVVVVLLGLLGGWTFSEKGWKVFSFNPTLSTDFWSVFSKYFFVIVAMERAASVWIGLDRSEKRRVWERRVNRMREYTKKPDPESVKPAPGMSLSDLRQMYHRESKIMNEMQGRTGFLGVIPMEDEKGNPKFKSPEEEKEMLMSYALVAKQVYEFKLARFEEQTYQLIMRVVFVGGVVLAFVGLSILGDILTINGTLETSQHFSYRAIDILLTGGLLGGGSKSFSVFLNTLNKVMNRVKDPKGES